MSLVTVKPKFQVTIPARLRRGLDLHEGDLLEAIVVGDGILLRPKWKTPSPKAAGPHPGLGHSGYARIAPTPCRLPLPASWEASAGTLLSNGRIDSPGSG